MHKPSPQPLELWLPDWPRFQPAHPLRSWVVCADRLDQGAAGYLAGLASHFVAPEGLPAAALTRDLLAGDAAGATWLSADPAWVQPDLNGVRLLACGQLELSMQEAQALAQPLLAVFSEAGMTLEVSSADRWHLRLPLETSLPVFASPEQALGEDLFQHLPQGDEGRRWRVLINELQVLLHQHPVNAARRERGLPPVNHLWLWGGGRLPHRVSTSLSGVVGDDLLLGALARHAGLTMRPRSLASVAAATAGELIDLQDLPAETIAATWWPSLQTLAQRQPLLLAFASGERWLHRPWHRMRFWRRETSNRSAR